MAKEYTNMGGASSSDPSDFRRWIQSKFMQKITHPDRIIKKRAKVEKARLKSGKPHEVLYFHQVDDPLQSSCRAGAAAVIGQL